MRAHLFYSDTDSVFGDHEVVERDQAQDVEEVQVGPRLREAFRSLDGVDVGHLFSMRAVLMKSPPAFVKGAYRVGLRVALREILQRREHSDDARSARGWKLFLLLPQMLLFRPPRGGLIPKQRFLDFQLFARGEWMQLLLPSRECCEKALSASIRRRRTQQDTPERRAERAQTMVLMGEVSAGRRVLEGAPLAPGAEATLRKLRQRLPAPRTPIAAAFSRQRTASSSWIIKNS